MKFRERLFVDKPIIFDGAMGTQIYDLNPTPEEYLGKIGCSEVLNLTIPDKIQYIHKNYLKAGAEVIETNTFGANKIVLKEYGLEDKVQEINIKAVQIAKDSIKKVDKEERCFIAGSIGPGTKLPSLGHIDYDEMYESYYEQAVALIKGGIDVFMIETCQDPLQIKIAVNSVKEAKKDLNKDIPIIVSFTVEETGTLLVGTDINAVVSILEGLDVDVIGMNCATGPDIMEPHVKNLSKMTQKPILVMPNAGIPQNVNGKIVYTMEKEFFAQKLIYFIENYGINIVGGCCGTTPEFIRYLKNSLKNVKIRKRNVKISPCIASLYSAQPLKQTPPPFYIGERMNTHGCKKFKKFLLNNEWDKILDLALQQQKQGAHGLDLCVSYTGRDEVEDMKKAIKLLRTNIKVPLIIDSTNLEVIDEGLKYYGGRAIINSINLENGEDYARKICRIAKKHSAVLIALTIDERGMAIDIERKLEIAKRIYKLALEEGLKPYELIFDPLTFTLGSGDEKLKNAGYYTLEGIKRIKENLPEVFTVLGISNISFGLSSYSREVLNSVFLEEAIKYGLDLAIVNVKKIIPFFKIDKEDKEVCKSLIYNKKINGKDPLIYFIEYFKDKYENKDNKKTKKAKEVIKSIDELIQNQVIEGNKNNLEELLLKKLNEMNALDIINKILIPAMKKVGDMFAKGETQLPFVLKSAEVMKFAIDKIKPYIDKKDEQKNIKIVLATVKGDVHDIGKNLVDIILTNNGYKVYNLGIKCDINKILKKAEEVKADIIGMSGLLVKSTLIMKENLEEMEKRGLKIPVFLGGAALTRKYVDEVCQKVYQGIVVYCADVFDSLNAINSLAQDKLEEFVQAKRVKHSKHFIFQKVIEENNKIEYGEEINDKNNIEIKEKNSKIQVNFENIPKIPFIGRKVVKSIENIEILFDYINKNLLFQISWGYKKKNLSKKEYENLINNYAKPELEKWKEKIIKERLIEPKFIYGYFLCNSKEDEIIIYDSTTDKIKISLKFPRQQKVPYRCISDYFLPYDKNYKDIIAFQVVTLGDIPSKISNEFFEKGQYKNYLIFHGISVQLTEALAKYVNNLIKKELNLGNNRGLRYSFGYPCCPNLEENRKILDILKAEDIGVKVSEIGEMLPEQTTSAFIVHNPMAKYFNI